MFNLQYGFSISDGIHGNRNCLDVFGNLWSAFLVFVSDMFGGFWKSLVITTGPDSFTCMTSQSFAKTLFCFFSLEFISVSIYGFS